MFSLMTMQRGIEELTMQRGTLWLEVGRRKPSSLCLVKCALGRSALEKICV